MSIANVTSTTYQLYTTSETCLFTVKMLATLTGNDQLIFSYIYIRNNQGNHP